MDYLLSHDLGTTGNKVCLFDSAGRLCRSLSYSYKTSYPRPGWAEQDSGDWKRSVLEGSRDLIDGAGIDPGEIAVVSFSGHMQGMLALDDEYQPLGPAIIWADQRAQKEAEQLDRRLGSDRVYELTGSRLSASYTAEKIAWFKQHCPEQYKRSRVFLQAKDYAAYLLSGVIATDYSDASLCQLLDIQHRCWADEIFEALELDPGRMPTLLPSDHCIGSVTEEASRASGLRAGTPVVIGAGDGACASLGAGLVEEGNMYAYVGSSSWIAGCSRELLLDREQRTFSILHIVPQLSIGIGTMQSAGGSLDWLEGLLRGDDQPQYEQLLSSAAELSPGARGLLFLPYLIGERSPIWNPNARAAFIGLSRSHGRAEICRAVLEGVAFNLKGIYNALESCGLKAEALRIIGGGSRSALWRQIIADIFQLPLRPLHLASEATSLGAAMAGAVGVGLLNDYSEVQRLIACGQEVEPSRQNAEIYGDLHEAFCEAYHVLVGTFDRLRMLQ